MTALPPSVADARVLVVGDVMLDRYIHGRTERVSREAPVPVVLVEGSDDRLGGAANVALNVVSLGARCTLVGAVADDDSGRIVARLLAEAGIDADLVIADDSRTTLKQRLVSMQQQLVRMDFESPLPPAAAIEVATRAVKRMAGADALVIEDYDKGAIANPKDLVGAARAHGVPTIADPKYKPFAAYRGVAILKPNRPEFEAALGYWPDADRLVEAGCRLARDSGVEAIALTRGGDGMTLFNAKGDSEHIPAVSVDVYDETGAGDTVAATLGVCTALAWPKAEAVRIANLAGGLVCGKFGTAPVTLEELNRAGGAAEATGVPPEPAKAVPSATARPPHPAQRGNGAASRAHRHQLAEAIAEARLRGERIVFTNGCFDILHAGHVAYLNEARELGDRLLVAVNDDDSVRRLKGDRRPVNGLRERMRVLEGLQAVDWVVPFSEDTPEALLDEVRPDVLVKGGDYALAEVVGADLVRSHGGDVRVVGLVDDCSSTAIVDRLREA